MKRSNIINSIKKEIIGLFDIPNGTCPICGRVLFSLDHFICGNCEKDLKFHDSKTCAACGRMVLEASATYCRDCLTFGVVFDGGYCHFRYGEDEKQIIWAMKFGNRRALCQWAGKAMLQGLLQTEWMTGCDVIVPVPISEGHLKIRGYNQSEKIAEGLAEALLDMGIVMPVAVNAIRRCKEGKDQIGSTREERISQLQGAFCMDDAKEIRGKKVLLIDDVITTGATLRECAEVLRQGGAESIYTAVCAG